MTHIVRAVLKCLAMLWLSALILMSAGCSEGGGPGPAPGPYSVAEVFDGDSFNLKAANGSIVRVRLLGIDAPEKGQPYSQKARESLESLLGSGRIELSAQKIDRFDRWIARATAGGADIGLSQIERGYAWFFVRYQKDLDETSRQRYADAERKARDEGRGLWAGIALSERNPALAPEPPWKYRERNRK